MNLLALIALQQLIASSTHVVARSVALQVPATAVVLYRGVLSVATYAGWLLWRNRASLQLPALERGDWWRFVVLGLVNMPLNQYLFVAGLRWTTAPNAALAFALSPVFVLVIARLLLGEAITGQKTLGVVLAVVGAAIVAFGRGAALDWGSMLGNVMELAACSAWSLYTVMGRPLVQRYGAVPTTALGMLWGLVLFIPVAAAVPGGLVAPHELTLRQWLEIAYLGIVTSGVGWSLWYLLLQRMEASKLAVFNNLQPLITVVLSWLIFGELPPPEFWIGGTVALIGVVLVQRA